jgi:phosphotransferase system enzyme I (PtsI)
MAEILKGIGAVAGTAVGKLRRFTRDVSDRLTLYTAEEPGREGEKFIAALAEAAGQIGAIAAKARQAGENSQADIMEAHLAILDDPMLKETVLGKIGNGMPAPGAVLVAVQEYAAVFAAMEDEYLRERGADILDIGNGSEDFAGLATQGSATGRRSYTPGLYRRRRLGDVAADTVRD